MVTDWVVLRDDNGRYLGRLNIYTLVLELVTRQGNKKTFDVSQMAKLIEKPPRQDSEVMLQFS